MDEGAHRSRGEMIEAEPLQPAQVKLLLRQLPADRLVDSRKSYGRSLPAAGQDGSRQSIRLDVGRFGRGCERSRAGVCIPHARTPRNKWTPNSRFLAVLEVVSCLPPLWFAHRTFSFCGRQCANAQLSVVVCALAHNLLWKSVGNDRSNTQKTVGQ